MNKVTQNPFFRFQNQKVRKSCEIKYPFFLLCYGKSQNSRCKDKQKQKIRRGCCQHLNFWLWSSLRAGCHCFMAQPFLEISKLIYFHVLVKLSGASFSRSTSYWVSQYVLGTVPGTFTKFLIVIDMLRSRYCSLHCTYREAEWERLNCKKWWRQGWIMFADMLPIILVWRKPMDY